MLTKTKTYVSHCAARDSQYVPATFHQKPLKHCCRQSFPFFSRTRDMFRMQQCKVCIRKLYFLFDYESQFCKTISGNSDHLRWQTAFHRIFPTIESSISLSLTVPKLERILITGRHPPIKNCKKYPLSVWEDDAQISLGSAIYNTLFFRLNVPGVY